MRITAHADRARSNSLPCNIAGRRAPARLRRLRRPRRLHDRVGGTGRRGHPRAAVPLLRNGPHDHRAIRGHGREVHRRCRHGRAGDACRNTDRSFPRHAHGGQSLDESHAARQQPGWQRPQTDRPAESYRPL